MKKLILLLPLILLAGCATPTGHKIRKDLMGHTMGGREKAWKFQSPDQIVSLKVLERTNNIVMVDMILRDPRVKSSYHAKARLTYQGRKLERVALLFIEQVR